MKKLIVTLPILLALAGCQQESQTDVPATTVEQAPPEAPAAVEPVASVSEAPALVCFLDDIGDAPAQASTDLNVGSFTKFRGWIGFMNGQGVSPEVFELKLMSAEQTYTFKQAAGAARQDVADSQAKPGLATAGYEFILPLTDVVPGVYEVMMSAKNNGFEASCTTGKLIAVK
jgi:Prokaryotic membrane lipoprotein lipid attachment site